MSKINAIQNVIKELEGGKYQKLVDAYLFKKYGLENINALGVQEGTDKTTKGTPDTYVVNEDGTYTLIMYGTVEKDAYKKLESDILSCFDKNKVKLEESKIKKIICTFTSTNLKPGELDALGHLIDGVEIQLIGLSTISHDLFTNYPFLAAEYLNIPIDTQQIYLRNEFIELYDRNGMNAPLNMPFIAREEEKEKLISTIYDDKAVLLTGASGVGKTRLALEVCGELEKDGWKTLCIKNNGQSLADDIKYYISEPQKYILFIDDANQTTSLEYVMTFITELGEDYEVRLLLSVRDYAKNRVEQIVKKFVSAIELKIFPLKSDEIKRLLEENLGIFNDEYIKQIVYIAKGNARLAVLAGKIAKDKGYLALRNAVDIFKHYYGDIFIRNDLDRVSLNSLFVITLFNTVKLGELSSIEPLLDVLGITSEEFKMACYDLNVRELVDLYQEKIVKVSDQSLGNYILQYILIENKSITIEQLLDVLFGRYPQKLVYALSTIAKLFYSGETEAYITEQVNASWNKAPDELQWKYLNHFYNLNQEKSLLMLKQRIDSEAAVEYDVDSIDFAKGKNFNSIQSKIINVLAGFKSSAYHEDAIQLLIQYYKKRPDLFMEFFFAFADRIAFDEYSHLREYEVEQTLVSSLWEASERGNDHNIIILYLRVVKAMMSGSLQRTRAGDDNNTFNIVTIELILNDGSKGLRKSIWQSLADLYHNNLYREMALDIMSDNYVNVLDEEKRNEIIKYDWDCIREMIFDQLEVLNFEECVALGEIEGVMRWADLERDPYFDRYKSNKEYMCYDMLLEKHKRGNTWEMDEEEHKRNIEQTIVSFSNDDFRRLFDVCRKCEKDGHRKNYSLETGLVLVFNKLSESGEQLYEVVKIYLECNAPYGSNMPGLIESLLQAIGVKNTKALIEENDFQYKDNWLCIFWSIIEDGQLDEKMADDFNQYIDGQRGKQYPLIPNIYDIQKFKLYDEKVDELVCQVVLESGERNSYIVSRFLGYAMDLKRAQQLVRLFKDELSILEDLYLIAMTDHFDYEGILLIELVDLNPNFWSRFTNKLKNAISRTSFESNVFNRIWERDDYSEKIEVAMDNMIEDHFYVWLETAAETIFLNRKGTSEIIKERKRDWIKQYIHKNIDDVEKIETIFGIIATIFPGDKIMFILEMVQASPDIKLFKNIPLFPLSSSWSGSEIPLIDKEIKFLEDLMNSLKGVNYIEHRAYLKERKDIYEAYRKNVLLREYEESYDFA